MAVDKQWIALIRAVLSATHKKMSMQDLKAACEKQGLSNVSTYGASGNLLFTSSLTKVQLTKLLNKIISDFDLDNAVVLRTPSQLKSVIESNPYANAATERPNLLHVVFYNKKLKSAAVAELEKRDGAERINSSSRELYVDYRDGVARSKLTPAFLDKQLGQAGTARNWNTLQKLVSLSG